MPLCKYGCNEEVTYIDGKPYSLQNHMKVCSKGNAGKKKPKLVPEKLLSFGKASIVTDKERASFDAALKEAEKGG